MKTVFKKIKDFFSWLKKFFNPYFLLLYFFLIIIYINRNEIWSFIGGIVYMPDPTAGYPTWSN
ncbi:MAG: hypothetical protein LBC92_02110 [Rickettsiales bacterium]|jgi:hypothetical protein|nr:hypothetical protein [Rickettsiales bacterium]